jgi:hypothetical protein
LAPCDFLLLPKIKFRLKGRRFDTIEENQAESQRVLDNMTEKNFKEALKNGDVGTCAYIREGITSRMMAADRPYGEFYDFYSVSGRIFWIPPRNRVLSNSALLMKYFYPCVLSLNIIYLLSYHTPN